MPRPKKYRPVPFKEAFYHDPDATPEDVDDVFMPQHIKGYEDEYDPSNVVHRAQKARDLRNEGNMDAYQQLMQEEKYPEQILEKIKAIENFNKRNNIDLKELSMNLLERVAKEGYVNKPLIKEEEVKKTDAKQFFEDMFPEKESIEKNVKRLNKKIEEGK